MINVHIIVFATIITQHPTQEPPTSTNGIYWFHIRKSGGTTVGNWLRKVAKSKNMSFSRTEGDVLNKTKESDVWVTTIRDPVDRIWSQYLYDGKWESPNWDRPPKYNFSHFCTKTMPLTALIGGGYVRKIASCFGLVAVTTDTLLPHLRQKTWDCLMW